MKLLSVLLSTILLSLSIQTTLAVGGPEVGTSGFTDVAIDHEYASAIEFVKSKGIVSGYADGTFKPNNTINRAEFTKILIEAIFDTAAINNCVAQNPTLFSDVKAADWFASYVCIAKLFFIINGYPDGSFKPGNTINYAEAAKIITISFNISPASINSSQQWYEAYTVPLQNLNAVPSSINGPTHNLTRGEMAEMISRLRDFLGQSDDNTSNPDNSALDSSADRQAVTDMVNAERAKEGLAPMSYNIFLEKSAQAHADDMRARAFFEHDTPDGVSAEDRIDRDGYLEPFHSCLCSKSYTVGENIAKGQATAAEVVETWMNSPQHRANIMSPDFNEIGIGLTAVDPNDTGFKGFFWVQNFGSINLQ
jgi:uncharacterized protein YkwD